MRSGDSQGNVESRTRAWKSKEEHTSRMSFKAVGGINVFVTPKYSIKFAVSRGLNFRDRCANTGTLCEVPVCDALLVTIKAFHSAAKVNFISL